METKFERPPNYAEIVAIFPAVKLRKGIIYTYGNTIYNPDRVKLTLALEAHERVHSRRQSATGPVEWWGQYLRDKQFRFTEELIAHQIEYNIALIGLGRNQRRAYLAQIAKRLAGPIYGNMVSTREAKRLIKVDLTAEATLRETVDD